MAQRALTVDAEVMERQPGADAEAWVGDDHALVVALRRGDAAAFEWLLDSYTPMLRRIAGSLLGASASSSVDDVVQETWLGVIIGLDGFEQRAAVRTWVVRILVNQARRRFGAELRTVPLSSLLSEPTVDPESFLPAGDEWAGQFAVMPSDWGRQPDARLEAAETMAVVGAAIAELPAAAREVITLRDVEGFDTAEVAAIAGTTAGNTRVLLHRARAHVRRRLDDYLDSERGVQR